MRKYDDSKYWYAITTAPDAGGRQMRYYAISCSRCGRQASCHAASLADDKLRKIFIRDGWDLGKSQKHHRCPECKYKPRTRVETIAEPPPAPKLSPLEAAWQAASKAERDAFLLTRCLMEERELNANVLGAVLEDLFQPEPTTVEPAPEPEPEEAPADWWAEMQKVKR